MAESNSLSIFSKASVMLAEANTVQKTKELKDMAIVAGEWARRKKLGEEAEQHCRNYALEAERKMGELLRSAEKNRGAEGSGSNQHVKQVRLHSVTAPPTLKELGITKRESAEAQFLASIPVAIFEDVKKGEKTVREVKRDIDRETKREAHKTKTEEAAKKPKNEQVKGPFDIILSDPPWKYDHAEAENRAIENHYNTATVEEICTHKVDTAKDSILFLWATAPKLMEAFQVMEAWGFQYKTQAVWDKEKMGIGYWFRGQHEILMVGTKGKVSPTPEFARVSSVFREKRGEHSKKPECVYEWIEKAFPGLKKLEMYCRTPRKGWASWGNEI